MGVFVRERKRINKRNGKVSRYLYLVRTYRDKDGKVKQEHIEYLGCAGSRESAERIKRIVKNLSRYLDNFVCCGKEQLRIEWDKVWGGFEVIRKVWNEIEFSKVIKGGVVNNFV